MRFSDLRIRWGTVGNVVAAPEAHLAGDNVAAGTGMRGWLTAGVLIGLALILLFALALGVLLYVRRRNVVDARS